MTRSSRRQRVAASEKKITRVAVGLVIAGPVLGMAAGALGAAEIYPYEYAVPVAISVMCTLIGAALLIGAVLGLYVMAGAKVAPFGVAFVAGFFGLLFGLIQQLDWLRDAGVLLLALSGAVFYAVGFGSGRLPRSAANTWGHSAAVAVGLIVAGVGYRFDLWGLLLFGAMAAGCGAGTLIARWWVSRSDS